MKIFIALFVLLISLSAHAQPKKSLQIDVYKTQTSLPATADSGQIAYCLDVRLPFTFDGMAWIPSARTVVKHSSVLVNGKATAASAIYTLENSGFNFYPIMIVPRAVNISGVTTPPTISIGTNATSYNNIASSSLLTSLLSTLSVGNGVPQDASFSPPIAGGSVIYANVTSTAIATNYTLKYDIIGFYDN